jgi:hypothetical protein
MDVAGSPTDLAYCIKLAYCVRLIGSGGVEMETGLP